MTGNGAGLKINVWCQVHGRDTIFNNTGEETISQCLGSKLGCCMKRSKSGHNNCLRFAETGIACYLEEYPIKHCGVQREGGYSAISKFVCVRRPQIGEYDKTRFSLIKLGNWFKLVPIKAKNESDNMESSDDM